MKLGALLTLMALGCSTPVAAQKTCLSDIDAEAMALVVLPDVIRETGRLCQAQLPTRSLLRRSESALLAKYQAAADRAWPAAQQAIVKLSDPAVTLLLGSDYARPVLSSLIAPLVVGRISVGDCPVADRLVTLLEPLPPANTAGLIVTAIRADQRKQQGRNGRAVTLPLCPAP